MGARNAGATPEELETLMEDAVVLQDGAAVAQLFEPNGMLVVGGNLRRGNREIALSIGLVSSLTRGYVAQPRRLYQSGDLVLLIGARVTSVARRGRDRQWRFVISLLDPVGQVSPIQDRRS